MNTLRPFEEWTEADGDVLWYRRPVDPDRPWTVLPWAGRPTDVGHQTRPMLWPENSPCSGFEALDRVPRYFTHWLPLPDVSLEAPREADLTFYLASKKSIDRGLFGCPPVYRGLPVRVDNTVQYGCCAWPGAVDERPSLEISGLCSEPCHGALGRLEQRVLREMGEGATGKGPEGLRTAIRTLAAALDELDEVVAADGCQRFSIGNAHA